MHVYFSELSQCLRQHLWTLPWQHTIYFFIPFVLRFWQEKIESATDVLKAILRPVVDEKEETPWPPRDPEALILMERVCLTHLHLIESLTPLAFNDILMLVWLLPPDYVIFSFVWKDLFCPFYVSFSPADMLHLVIYCLHVASSTHSFPLGWKIWFYHMTELLVSSEQFW